MTRDEITKKLLQIFSERFEIDDLGLQDDLREDHAFDSIDAIELLHEIEVMLGAALTREEKKQAMGISSLNEIIDYIEELAANQSATPSPSR